MVGKSKLVHVNITFRNLEATDALRTYTNEKLTHCLQKFIHQDTEAHVVLRVEKNRQIAEATLHVDGATINAKEEGDKLYSAIDALVDNLTQQLRKNKEKLTQHH
jgi:putative sigma-54 modulation protein